MTIKTASMLVIILLSLVFISGCTTESGVNETVSSFGDCAAAGNQVMESHPRQCRTPDGRLFVEEIDEPLIGGERDEHGCLGPAGYTWNEDVGACIRSWELDENRTEAARIAAAYVRPSYATTVVEVTEGRCEGCFTVKLEQGEDRNAISVDISNWKAVWDTLTRHACTEEEKQSEICTMDYNPVCGFMSDGSSETYANGCGACSAGVEYWEAGECV